MIFIGDGQIAHAYEVPMAVGVSTPPDNDIIVYRPVHPHHAEAAVKAARLPP